MKFFAFLKKRENLPLLLILALAFFLRFYKLGHESFWLDELIAMTESNPSWSLHQLFSALSYGDLQPPLFFLIQRGVVLVFGHSEEAGRLWPALAGVIAVWGMYRLGKELLGRRPGSDRRVADLCQFFCDLFFPRDQTI